MKKFFSIVLSLAMVTGCFVTFGTAAKADAAAAKIGTAEYATLEEAFTAAVDGDTVTLAANTTVTGVINITGKAVTLDLDGFTASKESTDGQMITIGNDGTLTVLDSSSDKAGVLVNNDTNASYGEESTTIYNCGGTLNLQSGTVKILSGGLSYAVCNSSNAWADPVTSTFNMTGGALSAPSGDGALRIYQNAGTQVSENYVNISGGTIVDAGIFVDTYTYQPTSTPTDNSATKTIINITDGTINGLVDFKLRNDKISTTISGGNFTNSSVRTRLYTSEAVITEFTEPVITVSGGTFQFKSDSSVSVFETQNANNTNAFTVTACTTNTEISEDVLAANADIDYADLLDLEASTTNIPATKDVAQNFNLTTEVGDHTDVTKVKLEWTVTDITANRKDAKIWNPDTLSWDENDSKDVITISQNGGATFSFTNLSSTRVNASVSFTAEEGFTAESVEKSTEKLLIGTVVNYDNTVNENNAHTGEITVAVTPSKSDFATLSATTGAKYGTYTVSITSALSQSDVNTIKNTYAADASNVPETFVIDKSAKTIEIQDVTAMIYYGMVYDNAAAVAAGKVAANSVVNITDDIDFEGLTIVNGLNAANKVNGNGHTIKNLTIVGESNKRTACFLNAADGNCLVNITNLVFDSINVYGDTASGTDVAVIAASGTVKDCTVKNSAVIGGKYTAAIVGHCYGSATGCTVENVSITGAYKIGAIAAYTEGGNAVDNNTVKNVKIYADNLISGKDHFEIGYIVGDWNSTPGSSSFTGNTATNVTIINNTTATITTNAESGNLVGYFDQQLGS